MSEREVYLKGIKPTSVGLFVGTFGALVGLLVAIVTFVNGTIFYTNTTNSLLAGLLLGIGIGGFALLVVPAFYFAVGWVVGWVEGLIINAVLRSSGGVSMEVHDPGEADMPMPARPTRTQPSFGETVDQRDNRRM